MRVELQVRDFEAEDMKGLIEQARDAGGDNLEIHKDFFWDNAFARDEVTVKILDDGGEVDMEDITTVENLYEVIVEYALEHGYFMIESAPVAEMEVDFGQFDIWDASNVFQIAAFGEVIIS